MYRSLFFAAVQGGQGVGGRDGACRFGGNRGGSDRFSDVTCMAGQGMAHGADDAARFSMSCRAAVDDRASKRMAKRKAKRDGRIEGEMRIALQERLAVPLSRA